MNSNKGITLISIIIYIIVLITIIGVISTFTKYFYKNINEITISDSADEQYSRFTEYLTSDMPNVKTTHITKQQSDTCLHIELYNRRNSSISFSE